MSRIILALTLVGLTAISSIAAKRGARSAKAVLRADELSGTWIPLQTCCPNPQFIFKKDGAYWHWCMDATRGDGKWQLRDGHVIMLFYESADEKGRPKYKHRVIVESVDLHSSRPTITVRYENHTIQTWLKKA